MSASKVSANFEPSEGLTAWYEKFLLTFEETFFSATEQEIALSLDNLDAYLEAVKAESEDTFATIYNTIKNETETNIQAHKEEYSRQLQETSEKLQSEGEERYSKEKLEEQLDQEVEVNQKNQKRGNGMFKTLKGKINGLVVLMLLISGGLALGGSDAGVLLQNWYNSLFNQKATEFNEDYNRFLKNEIEGMDTDIEGEKNGMVDTINGQKQEAFDLSEAELTDYKNESVDALRKKRDEISGNIGKQFEELLEAAKLVILETTGEKFTKSEATLESKAGEASRDAVDALNNELGVTAGEAIADLESEIDTIKKVLLQQLEDEKVLTDERVREIIKQNIETIRKRIQDKRVELENEQKAIILEHAKKLEKQAKDELDAVINSI